jgi:hypothetical protein
MPFVIFKYPKFKIGDLVKVSNEQYFKSFGWSRNIRNEATVVGVSGEEISVRFRNSVTNVSAYTALNENVLSMNSSWAQIWFDNANNPPRAIYG